MTNRLIDYLCIKITNIIGRIQRKAEYVKLNEMTNRFSSFGSDSVFHFFDYKVINPQYISVGSNVHFGHRVRLEVFDEYTGVKFAPPHSKNWQQRKYRNRYAYRLHKQSRDWQWSIVCFKCIYYGSFPWKYNKRRFINATIKTSSII